MNSMTGFGAAAAPLGSSTIRVEIGGVNRKQTEIAISLPRAWSELEAAVRDVVAGTVSRGRVNVTISMQAATGRESCGGIAINQARLVSLQEKLPQLEAALGQPITPSLDAMLRLGILEEETDASIEPAEAWAAIEPVLREALTAFTTLRAEEGANLCQDLLARVATLRDFRTRLMERAGGVVTRHRENLMKRLAESGLELPLEDERLIKEIALFADKCDVSEEMTRLASHLDQFERICAKDEPVGRTLDFLCQEIFRELNTTGSKANDAELAQLVVTAKTALEKIREQVQNVE